MAGQYDEHLPNELEPIAARLRAERVEADPLRLDSLKQRLMTKNNSRQGRPTFMKSRIATILTVVGLAAGTGGALAIASEGNHGGNGGADHGQYCDKKGEDHDHGKCERHHHHHHHHHGDQGDHHGDEGGGGGD
jgi:hypothetical protein